MDEFTSVLRHSDEPNFRVTPFLFMPEGNLASVVSYSSLWPTQNVWKGDECTRDVLLGNNAFDGKLLTEKLRKLNNSQQRIESVSFVYLTPALVIINAQEYQNLTEHKFRHIMRELQGAIIVGLIFQCILGFSGLMSILLRLINPVVVAPTVAAVGLVFFSYGFQQVGICMKISVPQIALVLFFTLYLRGISTFGRHLF
ncbi:hypothetical protein KIW84_055554 [Lathyrus oleraceus]|uniref:Tubulin--tyrosine ligase-like protein 12 SET-like domain-containing protein n=1 Tax=Pisum sativum TaxID=3888 RepID=A0A9D4WY70_PEA|nr:hypothetical protein KIW84_055554 [Pisum sativum]